MHILVAIVATLALLPWFTTPSQASERTVARMGDLQATISQTTQWCGETVEVRVHAPDAAQLSDDTRQLQLLAGGVRQILGLECPAIQQLQLIGSVDGQTIGTWTHTADGQLIAAQTATQPVSTVQSTPIGREEIAEAQQILSELGYEPGPVDGLMGQKTKRAIHQFQRDKKLALDGVASPQLLEKLRSVVAARQSGPAVAESTPRPSFDCARAGTPTEFAICASPELPRLDRQMADAYALARAGASNPSAVVNAQRNWISRRNTCGGDVTCLRTSMQNRLAALKATPHPVSSSGELAHSSDIPGDGKEPDTVSLESGQPVGTSVREDGIRVHSSGRLIVPYPVHNTHSPEGKQIQALIRLLRHAEVAETMSETDPSEMAPSDYPAYYADIARDYLSPSEFQPFFCTPDEMKPDASNCMNFSDASWHYSIAGGQIENTAKHALLWWRGATEFERRRTMNAFAESGLREQIIASAPDTPIRLLYTISTWLDNYDFDARHFPVTVRGGAGPVELPGRGRNSVVFDLGELAQPVSVPPPAAEPLRQNFSMQDDGRSEVTLGVEVDITLDDSGWNGKVISSAYFLDSEATQPLTDTIEIVTGASEVETATTGNTREADPGLGSVLRQFDLDREEGRIVIDFEGYGQPTSEAIEAINYLFASAARDFVEAATEDFSTGKYVFPVLFSILNEDVRTTYFNCMSANRCYDRNTKSYFSGENEFKARQMRIAYEEEIAPKLIAEAPTTPIPMRIYLDARLSEYDFDKEGFEVRIRQVVRSEIDSIPRMFDFKPIFDLVPGFIPMSPESAERLINAVESDPVLRLDYDVLSFMRLRIAETSMKVRPVAVALTTGDAQDAIHFQQTYDTAEQPNGQGSTARAFLGPEITGFALPGEPTAYPVLGVAPGMTLEAAVDALSQSFSDAEITVANDILRAERGYCDYEGAEGGADEDGIGAICFVARLKDQRISRVALQQIVHPGQLRNLNDETRARFGAPDSRGEGDVPAGSMLREYFGWGEELRATRAMLSRPEIGIPAHEAEVDHIYVNGSVAVATLRVDAPPATAARAAGPESTTSEASSSAPEVDGGSVSDGGEAMPESADMEAADKELALLGIAPRQSRAEAQSILEDRFGEGTLAQADDGTLIIESGSCRYAVVSDPAIETEAGSTCVIVVFGPNDAVSNIVVRNVVAGAFVEAYTAQLEGRFGEPADRVHTDEAPQTLILGWGPELEATAAELERDASAGQVLHALEARLTEANGVTLVTMRLDTEPASGENFTFEEGDGGSAPPPIDF